MINKKKIKFFLEDAVNDTYAIYYFYVENAEYTVKFTKLSTFKKRTFLQVILDHLLHIFVEILLFEMKLKEIEMLLKQCN